ALRHGAAEDDVVDVGGRKRGGLADRGTDHLAGELVGTGLRERALRGAGDGAADGSSDDEFVGPGQFLNGVLFITMYFMRSLLFGSRHSEMTASHSSWRMRSSVTGAIPPSTPPQRTVASLRATTPSWAEACPADWSVSIIICSVAMPLSPGSV